MEGRRGRVPFVDCLTTILDDSLPLTPPEWTEWGNPIESKTIHDLMLSYSPYDNVEAKDYPAMLITGGLTDPRVTYWEPAKWAAKLRATKTDDNLLLMKINMEAGHAGSAGRFDKLKEVALNYAFLLKVFGKAGIDFDGTSRQVCSMSETTFVILPNRGLLRVSGEEAEEFLQNLVSNDVTRATADTAVYSTLLTPQGKFLHDFFVVRDEDGFLLDCEADRLDDLKRRLTMYKLRAKVILSDETDRWLVLAVLEGKIEGALLFDDPRRLDLGKRAIVRAGDPIEGEEAPFENWDARRISLGIPDGSRDIEVEKSFLLEHRMDELNAIDFKKGCYVGQELTARTKYRGNVRKKLTHVSVEGDLPPAGTPVLADGIEIGTVRSGLGNQALAILRIERPDGELEAGDAKLVAN